MIFQNVCARMGEGGPGGTAGDMYAEIIEETNDSRRDRRGAIGGGAGKSAILSLIRACAPGSAKRGHCLVSAACAHAPRVSLAASELRVSSETHGVDSRPTGAEASKNIDAV